MEETAGARRTPLYDEHVKAGGKMVPFAGYLLPVQYNASGVIAEHMAVRTRCGLFDVSHMGEMLYRGPDALACINEVVCNDMTGMDVGQARYSPMCNEHGGVVDDLIVYRMGDNDYYVVVNAANREKDAAWMRARVSGNCEFTDISDSIAQLALQGPAAQEILERLCDKDDIPVGYYTCTMRRMVANVECVVSRTGYTGEDGFELYCAAEESPKLWEALLAAGADEGLIPCGLGARDTLRLEAAMPLYGHEMSDDITPYEARLGMFVKLAKDGFVGKDALAAQKAEGVARKRVGLKMTGRGIAREECEVFDGDERVGVVTSGTHCPFLGGAYAMALLPTAYDEVGREVQVDVRGRRIEAEVCKLPFYKRES